MAHAGRSHRRGGREERMPDDTGDHGRRTRSGRDADIDDTMDGLAREPIMLWSIGRIADFAQKNTENPRVTTGKLIVTYTWHNNSSIPSITVPGAPREFYGWKGGDLSEYFRQHREANKDKTLDAMFMAVRTMQPDFKLTNYDVACDNTALSSLLRFCLDTASSIRMNARQSGITPWHVPSISDGKVRIEAQVVGSVLMMCREQERLKHAGGVGIKYMEVCSNEAPTEMMVDGQRVDGQRADAFHGMIKEVTIGNTRMLLNQKIVTARYPTTCEQPIIPCEVPADVKSMRIAIGGFKGDPNELTPIMLASRKTETRERPATFHPSKWFEQYLSGTPYHYIGRHDGGVFVEPPALKSSSDIQQLCGLDDSAAGLTIKVLHCVLTQILTFARGGRSSGRFCIVSDPDKKCIQIYSYANGKGGGQGGPVISEETLSWLKSTMSRE